ncbi:hypothetical protein E2320_009044, partial [Naja naja]
ARGSDGPRRLVGDHGRAEGRRAAELRRASFRVGGRASHPRSEHKYWIGNSWSDCTCKEYQIGNSNGLLLVRLAGVELTSDGVIWLKEEMKPSQMIWFQLLGRKESALDCFVIVNKGRFSSICLNEEILRRGLGKTVRIEGLAHESRIYWKLHKRLLQAEMKAVKKKKGIWKEETFIEKLKEHISNYKFIQKLKQFAIWLRIRL